MCFCANEEDDDIKLIIIRDDDFLWSGGGRKWHLAWKGAKGAISLANKSPQHLMTMVA